jgi:kanamycin kinase
VRARPPVPLAAGHILAGEWEPVFARSYGTTVYRVLCDRTYYVKVTSTADRGDPRFHPATEADGLVWLATWGFPVPEVVETGAADGLSWLVTGAVPGVPAAGPWEPAARTNVLDAVADLAAQLHSVPAGRCPIDRTLAVTLPRCRLAVELATVDLDDLDERHLGWTAEDLLAELDATPVPPEEDVVVCHGDLSLDNILIDPDTLTVTGILDAGRLGRADRWLDLSVILRDITEDQAQWGFDAERFLHRYGLSEVDQTKYEYYRLLDEFI